MRLIKSLFLILFIPHFLFAESDRTKFAMIYPWIENALTKKWVELDGLTYNDLRVYSPQFNKAMDILFDAEAFETEGKLGDIFSGEVDRPLDFDRYQVYQIRLDPVMLEDGSARYELRMSLLPDWYKGWIFAPPIHVGFQLEPKEFERLTSAFEKIRKQEISFAFDPAKEIVISNTQSELISAEVKVSLKAVGTRLDFVSATDRVDTSNGIYSGKIIQEFRFTRVAQDANGQLALSKIPHSLEASQYFTTELYTGGKWSFHRPDDEKQEPATDVEFLDLLFEYSYLEPIQEEKLLMDLRNLADPRKTNPAANSCLACHAAPATKLIHKARNMPGNKDIFYTEEAEALTADAAFVTMLQVGYYKDRFIVSEFYWRDTERAAQEIKTLLAKPQGQWPRRSIESKASPQRSQQEYSNSNLREVMPYQGIYSDDE